MLKQNICLPCDDGELVNAGISCTDVEVILHRICLPCDDGEFTKESILVSAALELEQSCKECVDNTYVFWQRKILFSF
ncbi:Uncharacterized protein APZ42_005939 [Daphnia magna]|uniref:Uncharacterized protein n=1 Tax=Daphnia magna TaxID=35525 RepID=A0A164G680_9CRUS|nr:Uncharacterized protein APZ42_005939 [Daphnia magna]